MRRWLLCLLVLGLSSTGLAAEVSLASRKTRQARTVTSSYDAPAVGASSVVVVANCGYPNTGCAYFQPIARERFVDIVVEDASGLPAYADIYINAAGSPLLQSPALSICGHTDKPLKVRPGDDISVLVMAAGGDLGVPCAGLGSQGSVTASFSRR